MRLTVGILTHNSEHVAARSLETVVTQKGLGELGKEWRVICLDNASADRIALTRLENRFPHIIFRKEHRNLGFARAHNRIMQEFPSDFHAVLNIDVLFEPDYLMRLLKALLMHSSAGSAIGKLLRWNLGTTNERTTIIDSAGLQVTASHVFSDRGQGEMDHGQYDMPQDIFGGTGAAVVYRRSSLEEIAYSPMDNGQWPIASTEFFDETMFMYKEDIDLAYRLLSAGHPCRYVPDAVCWHARTVGALREALLLQRWKRSRQERIWSTTHETLLLRKQSALWPPEMKRSTRMRQSAKNLYLFFLEPRVFLGTRRLLRSLKEGTEKRIVATKHCVPFASIAHFFE